METEFSQWLDANRQLAILLVPALAFAEGCIGIGLFVSGIFLVIVCTTLVVNELASLFVIAPLALAGATLGDHVGYYAGRWIGPGFHHTRIAERHRDKLDRAEAMIRERGWLAILIGRFIPAIRSLIPALLGISGFDRLRYTLVDVLACTLWACGLALIVSGASAL